MVKQMHKALITVLLALALAPAAQAQALSLGKAERAVTEYTQRVDVRAVERGAAWLRQAPGRVRWTERSESDCTRYGARTALCHMGLVGRMDGEWIYCSNTIAVHPRVTRGSSHWPDVLSPWAIVRTRTLRLVPDFGLDCFGDEVMRVDDNSEPMPEGTWEEGS